MRDNSSPQARHARGVQQRFPAGQLAYGTRRQPEAPSRLKPVSAPSHDSSEYALGFLGVFLAVGSAAFAAHMLSDENRKPEFNGIEHLAIYSRPTRSTPTKHVTIAQVHPRPADSANIDYTPVGSIARSSPIDKFELLQTNGQAALIRLPSGQAVYIAAGEYLDGAGRIQTIRRQQGRWVIETDRGDILQRPATSLGSKP